MVRELEKFFKSVDSGNKNATWNEAAIRFHMSGNALRKRYKKWKDGKTKNYQNTVQDGLWICIFDAHVPFHNKRMFESIYRLIQDTQPKGLVLGGDFLDLHSLSTHDKGKTPIPGMTLEENMQRETMYWTNWNCTRSNKRCIFGETTKHGTTNISGTQTIQRSEMR